MTKKVPILRSPGVKTFGLARPGHDHGSRDDLAPKAATLRCTRVAAVDSMRRVADVPIRQ